MFLKTQVKTISISEKEIEDSAITEIKKTVEAVTKKFLMKIYQMNYKPGSVI